MQFDHFTPNKTLCSGPPALYVLDVSLHQHADWNDPLKPDYESEQGVPGHRIRDTWLQRTWSVNTFEIIMVCAVLLTGHLIFVLCEATSYFSFFSILYISNLCPQLCCEPVNWFRQWTRAAQLSMHNKHASFSSSTYTPFQFGSPFNCTNFPSAFLPVNTCAALQCCSLFFESQHQTSTHLQTSMGVSRYFLITPQYFCAKVCEEWWGWSPDHKLK